MFLLALGPNKLGGNMHYVYDLCGVQKRDAFIELFDYFLKGLEIVGVFKSISAMKNSLKSVGSKFNFSDSEFYHWCEDVDENDIESWGWHTYYPE